MTSATITKTIFLNASPDLVWSFLTDKDKLGQWYHPAQDDLANGQDYTLLEAQDDGTMAPIVWGKVLEMVPNSKLVCTFLIKPLGGNETTVTWTLEDAFDGTKLSLVHEGICEAAGEAAKGMILALDAGWDAHLGKMRLLAK